MVEVVRAAKKEPLSFVDRKILGEVLNYGVPVLVLLVGLVALNLTLDRAGSLRTWSESYEETASYLAVGCESVDRFSGDQWRCSGSLDGERATDSSVLVTSRNAASSSRPYVGERLDVFHATGDDATVYPLQYRLNELTRLYLSLLPRLLLLIGSIIWLAGWFLTRKLDASDFVTRDALRLPQRFSWKSRGVTWMLAAAGVLALNHFLTTRILGSLGIL
jgi:hypothetical protein